jgi:hypothetical protein
MAQYELNVNVKIAKLEAAIQTLKDSIARQRYVERIKGLENEIIYSRQRNTDLEIKVDSLIMLLIEQGHGSGCPKNGRHEFVPFPPSNIDSCVHCHMGEGFRAHRKAICNCHLSTLPAIKDGAE